MKTQFLFRVKLFRMAILAGFVIILLQVIRIQSQKDRFLPEIENDKFTQETLYPERGEIYDRNGTMLAGNVTVYEIGLNLPEVTDKEFIAKNFSEVTGMDYQSILDKINEQPSTQIYLMLKDYVPADQGLKLITLQAELKDKYKKNGDQNLFGLEFRPKLKRTYPDKTLASNLLGFVNQDNAGYYGIEEKYNNLLAGMPVIVNVPIDPTMAADIPKVPVGTDLILTIDRNIQMMVEAELKDALSSSKSEAGTIVVMDPRTGEILGMASSPQMDLNDYSNYLNVYSGTTPFNRAVSDQYEPGSVFKILTMAAAIDTGLVSPGTTYLDTGYYNIGGVNITNWDQGAWGVQDMVGCMQHSLNVCMARLADLMGEKTFYTYMQRFGIGHPTGIDLANEASGRLKNPNDNDWYKVDLGTNSFGQGVSVTPVQMMAAVSAIANDGKMVYPHLVYAMINNGVQRNTPPQSLGTPVSTQTAHTVNEMMAQSIEGGEAIGIVDGYRLAGKTGTASIPGPDQQYDPNLTNASFIGWGPVDDPKFMVYVWLEKPHRSEWASEMAAPVFRSVVEKLVVLMDIPPDEIRHQLAGKQ